MTMGFKMSFEIHPKNDQWKKKNMLNFIKIKKFCSMKDSVKRMKKQAIDLEKIFAKLISNKWLVANLYKELFKFKNNKTNNLIKTKAQSQSWNNLNKKIM